jgi:hypothetical protein
MPETKEPLIFLRCSAKKKVFDNGGSVLNVSIKGQDLTEFLSQHVNERGYLNLRIQKRREVGQYGDTHMVTLDTWKPKTTPITESDIPF